MKQRSPAELIADIRYLAARRKLYTYRPYGHPDTLCPDGAQWRDMHARGEWGEWSNRPWQWEFHAAGADNQERMICAGNRPGKTCCGAAEVAMHLTGEYPEWWRGKRFQESVLIWTGSPTNESSRDIVQKELLGGTGKDELGTGMIPAEHIDGRLRFRQCGVNDVVDTVRVRHVPTGGISKCIFKSYEQGWRKWQGAAPQVVWMDEEPEDSNDQRRIRTEALTRLLTSHGILMVTFTPLLGATDFVQHFQTGGDGIWMTTATWDDAPHLLKDERERMFASYPEHERDARTRGVPMLGEGRIFSVPEDSITVNDFEIPSHWARIKGIDFGMDHPAAVAEIAWDRDNDRIYVVRTWRKRNAEFEEHAEAINQPRPWVPVSWPHDGESRRGGASGPRLRDLYASHGCRMLAKSARYKNDKGGSQPVWPIVEDLRGRMNSGGFQVFRSCHEFFDEFRMYHHVDGKLSVRHDDVLKAVFYAVMMRRYAATSGGRRVSVEMPAPLRV